MDKIYDLIMVNINEKKWKIAKNNISIFNKKFESNVNNKKMI